MNNKKTISNCMGKTTVHLRHTDLLDKSRVEKLKNDFIVDLCKSAIKNFIMTEETPEQAFFKSNFYIVDLLDAETIDESTAYELSKYTATLYSGLI